MIRFKLYLQSNKRRHGASSYLAADDVVRRHADLAAVHELAPGQALDGVLQVPGVVHEGRGLAAQLQRHRRQVLVGCCTENTKVFEVFFSPSSVVRANELENTEGGIYPIIFPTAVLPV